MLPACLCVTQHACDWQRCIYHVPFPNHIAISTQLRVNKIRQKWVLTYQIACKIACLERLESKIRPIYLNHLDLVQSTVETVNRDREVVPVKAISSPFPYESTELYSLPHFPIPFPCLEHCISIYYCLCKQVCHAPRRFLHPKGTSQCHYR